MKRRTTATKTQPKTIEAEPFTNPTPEPEAERKPLAWEVVFRCQRSPVYRSEMVTALMAGTAIPVERLPVAMLADAVLMATACREHCAAEVVDDYQLLINRMEETFSRADYSARVSDTTFLTKVSSILMGYQPFVDLETDCVPALAAWYLAQVSVPSYFVVGGEL